MDIRLFKFLIFTALETVLVISFYAFGKIGFLAPAREIASSTIILLIAAIPLLLMLPEDNWIWIVEEDPRVRKITMRSKAVKHLHLSMLYLFALGFPMLVVASAIAFETPSYRSVELYALAAFGFCYGVFAAIKNQRNLMEHASVFAVGWDRRASFFEIFVGLRVSRRIKFFFSRTSLMILIAYLAAATALPYWKNLQGKGSAGYIDEEKYLVMQTIFSFCFAMGVWITACYVFFQMFFSRSLERWIREVKREIPQGVRNEDQGTGS